MKGVLLVNLGSPDSTSVADVRKYLREFLMDGRVLDTAFPIRWFVVNCLILPKRPAESAEAYSKVWLPEGSPLVVISKNVQKRVQEKVEVPVELAMRYQSPSIESALKNLAEKGVDDLLLIPLFPHYAMSSFETAVERVKELISANHPGMKVTVQSPFYDHPGFIDALVETSADYLKQDYDLLLFSFHGLPERHLRKSDPTGNHCLVAKDCCSGEHPAHQTCYRAQCYKTVQAFVKKAGIPERKYAVSFQSRLGRDPWLKPYTDFELERFAKEGIKRVLVACPAFVSDCLETLEEIGMRGKEDFENAGGEDLKLIPCVNEHPKWIATLEGMINKFASKREIQSRK